MRIQSSADEPVSAGSSLPRLQLVELEDLPWFPRLFRDLATDYLEFVGTRIAMDREIAPILREALERAGATRVVDLCSGGGGPVRALRRRLAEEGLAIEVMLTDRFPNLAAFRRLALAEPGLVAVEEAVDARSVPPSLTGFRTLFNAFHHFGPADARGILRDAVRAGEGIAVFELSERSLRMLIPVLLTPVLVWGATPWIRPFRWRRLLWTYPIPVVPLLCLWDGVVSQFRSYRPAELRELSAGLDDGGYRWQVGTVPVVGAPARITFLTGVPERRTG
ncbi:MAG: hypothetical protein KJZ74_11985 [Gemmatimonadales bacterium]|nr:class I SAM-dependent methyltransferase [Gemmatimonadota bacterium]MCL4214628.1 hypothetical protein [Gemmatimonadales bacterium]